MVPTPIVVAESLDWGFGNRLQTPTKVLTCSGQFNVQHDVHVQFYSFAFLYSLPLDMDRGGASRVSRSRNDLFHAGDDLLMLPWWLSLDWLVYPIPLWGLGCKPLQERYCSNKITMLVLYASLVGECICSWSDV